MSETHYGNKYDEALGTTEIAKRIRADIKAAVKAGTLPAGIKVSVRTRHFAGGSSIDLDITAFPENTLNLAEVAAGEIAPLMLHRFGLYTSEAARALSELEAIMGAYNFDGSDTQTDYFHVKFYGHAGISRELQAAHRAELLAREAELITDMRITKQNNPGMFEAQLGAVDSAPKRAA